MIACLTFNGTNGLPTVNETTVGVERSLLFYWQTARAIFIRFRLTRGDIIHGSPFFIIFTVVVERFVFTIAKPQVSLSTDPS